MTYNQIAMLHSNYVYLFKVLLNLFVGFAPDVKVWEVQFTKSDEFKQVTRAFVLTGHTSGVCDFSFSSDSSKMATVSKDGSWKVFNTHSEYIF